MKPNVLISDYDEHLIKQSCNKTKNWQKQVPANESKACTEAGIKKHKEDCWEKFIPEDFTKTPMDAYNCNVWETH